MDELFGGKNSKESKILGHNTFTIGWQGGNCQLCVCIVTLVFS
jgi:hypothetical protein